MEPQVSNFLLNYCVLLAKTQCSRLIFMPGWNLRYGQVSLLVCYERCVFHKDLLFSGYAGSGIIIPSSS